MGCTENRRLEYAGQYRCSVRYKSMTISFMDGRKAPGPRRMRRFSRARQIAVRPERRARAAAIRTRIGNHSFPRATGVTEYLKNGGKLEIAQQMANHENARTTGLYDRRNDQVSLDEVEPIVI